MGETGWRARIGENAMVELLEQNRASATGNKFILWLFCSVWFCELCVTRRWPQMRWWSDKSSSGKLKIDQYNGTAQWESRSSWSSVGSWVTSTEMDGWACCWLVSGKASKAKKLKIWRDCHAESEDGRLETELCFFARLLAETGETARLDEFESFAILPPTCCVNTCILLS